MACQFTGQVETGNGSYYSGYIIFLDKETFKFSPYHPKYLKEFIPKSIEYSNQVYGHWEPWELPERFKGSVIHEAIWHRIYTSRKYQLNDYINHRFTAEDALEVLDIDGDTWGGGSFNALPGFCILMVRRKRIELYDSFDGKPKMIIKPGQMAEALTDIMKIEES